MVDPYAAGRAHWAQCYEQLRELKILFEKENNRAKPEAPKTQGGFVSEASICHSCKFVTLF